MENPGAIELWYIALLFAVSKIQIMHVVHFHPLIEQFDDYSIFSASVEIGKTS